jgi:hemolysin III
MARTNHRPAAKIEEFSLSLFTFTVLVTFGGLLGMLWMISPATWAAQFIPAWWRILAAFAAVSLLNCFIEYFFHRYVLHQPAIPFLRRLYRQHTLHHGLTNISRRNRPDGRGLIVIENKFPILEPEQGEASFFPWYTLAVFAAILTPILAGLQWLLPHFPWFLGGFAALASSLALYEILHAINHWSLDQWLPLIEHRHWGWFWRPVYGFHLRHHAVIDCNESISGFFGLPIADWVFGTCIIPRTVYADGEEWAAGKFTQPRPVALIRWLDACAIKTVQRRRAAAQSAPTEAGAAPNAPRSFTRGEEIANWVTHGIGLMLSIVAMTLLIVYASLHGDAWHVVSFTVFGLTLMMLYAASTFYHFWQSRRGKAFFRKMDHIAVFLLIAGTYTPLLLTNLRGPWGWTLFGIVWGLCGAGAVFQFIAGGRFRFTSMLACLFIGWLIVVAVNPLLSLVPNGALWLLLAGGLCYTGGVVFYRWHRLRYHHAMWHTFVLGGSTCHFLAVLLFLLPHGA